MSHSQLPWKTGAANEDGSLIYDAEDNIVASTEDNIVASTEDISKFSRSIETEAREDANAALIVTAVNSHAELLALLKELVDIEGPQPGHVTWARKLLAAIAKVEGRANG